MTKPNPTVPIDAFALLGLPPAIGPDPRLLVLGSMPGAESLARGQYYAHPRNAFWRLIEDVFAIPRTLDYAPRVAALNRAGVALWDVLAECRRRGSLDAAIAREGRRANDVAALLRAHPRIGRVLLNGALAAQVFDAQVAAHGALPARIQCLRLPSTSPANASVPYARKLALWSAALRTSD